MYGRATLPGVKTALFQRDGAFYLFATNLNASDLHCRVELDALTPTSPLRVTDLWTGEVGWALPTTPINTTTTTPTLPPTQVVIGLPARSGGAWLIEK